ncbi:hypothetical protein ILT44_18165, partial [Microvirga sp. BT689]|uniref:calcium-binding protein n=1 Tax=Microvirga arvi TaxID=2778731 RepID=UPI00272DC890
MYMGGGFSLQDEWARHYYEHGGSVRTTYGGGYAGSGPGGVGGAGPIGIDANGNVRTGNRSFQETFADGSTLDVAIRSDGSKTLTVKDLTRGFITTYTEIPGSHQRWDISYLNGDPKITYTIDFYPGNRKIVTLDDHVMETTVLEEYSGDVLLSRVEDTGDVNVTTHFFGPRTLERETTTTEGISGQSKAYEYRYTNEKFEVGTWYRHDIDRLTSSDNVVDYREQTSTALLYNGRPALDVITINRTERPGEDPDVSSTREIVYFDDRLPPEGEFEAPAPLILWDVGAFNTMADALIDSGGPQKHGMMTVLSGIGTHSVEAHVGTSGVDYLVGHGFLYAGGGQDTLIGGRGADLLDGGEGLDIASYEQATSGVAANLGACQSAGEAAGDVYASIEGLAGSAYADRLTGDGDDNILIGHGGNDALAGYAGYDVLQGGTSADQLDGGNGFDIASYEHAASEVVANLSNPALNTGEAAGDTYISIEGLRGSKFNDALTGNSLGNLLDGNAGDDVLEGGLGDDTLQGGAGYDYASYSTARIGVVANLSDALQNLGQAHGDRYDSIEG